MFGQAQIKHHSSIGIVHAPSLSSYLRSVTLAKLSTKRPESQEFRKYYGKRVRKLIFGDESSSKFSLHRCKVLKSLIPTPSLISQSLPKSIKHIFIPYTNFQMQDENLSNTIKRIANCKNLESLQIEGFYTFPKLNRSFCRKIKMFNHLHSLEVTIYEDNLLEISTQILKIRSLKKLKLKVREAVQPNKNLNVSIFYSKLISSKTLTHLGLNLQYVKYTSTVVSLLLQDLSQTSLPSFEIRLAINSAKEIDDLDAALLQADLVTFSTNYNAMSLTSVTAQNNNLSLSHTKRRLHFCLSIGRHWKYLQINATQPHKNIKEFFSYFAVTPFLAGLELKHVAKLKSLTLNFSGLPRETLQSKGGQSLFCALEEASDLEHLNFKGIDISNNSVATIIEPIFAKISNLCNLKVLDLTIPVLKYAFLEIIAKPIRSLVNLTKLRFEVSSSDSSYIDVDYSIVFPVSCKLTELDILLPKLNLNSKKSFINALGKLRELQKLRIVEGPQLLDEGSLRIMLLETLMSLTELKELEVLDALKLKIELSQGQELEEKRVALELREYMRKMFDKNRNLRKVSLKKDGIYEIKYEIN